MASSRQFAGPGRLWLGTRYQLSRWGPFDPRLCHRSAASPSIHQRLASWTPPDRVVGDRFDWGRDLRDRSSERLPSRNAKSGPTTDSARLAPRPLLGAWLHSTDSSLLRL